MKQFIPILILLLFPWLVQFIEVYIESKKGDRNHGASLALSFILSIFPGVFMGGEMVFFLGSFLSFVAFRCWFDLIYNKLKGHPWHYLGTEAKSDVFLKRFPKVVMFFGRFAISSLSLGGFFILFSRYYESISSELYEQFGVFSAVIIFTILNVVGITAIIKQKNLTK